jgi:molecular chaperone GrpE (heat shock protein)
VTADAPDAAARTDREEPVNPGDPALAQAAAESDCGSSLPPAEARLDLLNQALADLRGQSAFTRQQISQLHEAVRQLYDAVTFQCRQLQESDQALLQELQRFQTGGPQRAMAAVFHKLFRDLLRHVAHLDDLVALGGQGHRHAKERPWIEALGVTRNGFERVLQDWGCTPIDVRVGEEQFDPERHEAVAAEPGEIPAGTPEQIVVRVRRRGWQLHGSVLQYPLVVVS